MSSRVSEWINVEDKKFSFVKEKQEVVDGGRSQEVVDGKAEKQGKKKTGEPEVSGRNFDNRFLTRIKGHGNSCIEYLFSNPAKVHAANAFTAHVNKRMHCLYLTATG